MDFFAEPPETVKLTRRLIGLEARIEALEALERGLYVDPGVDWVGRVVRERLLADLHTRMLRQAQANVSHAR
jgi:hypothetical protein